MTNSSLDPSQCSFYNPNTINWNIFPLINLSKPKLIMNSTLDICIISASNLLTVEVDADVYVVAWLICGNDEFSAGQSTTIASAKNDNLTWNFPVRFAVSDLLAPNSCQIVCLQLRCYYQQIHNYEEEIGEVYLPVYDLLDSGTPGSSQFVTRRIRDKFGDPIGELNLSYKLNDGDQHRRWTATPSAPPLPPPPDPPPSQLPERTRGRDFPLKAAIAAAATLMAPQMADLLVKAQELVVKAIALVLVFFILVGALIFLLGFLRRLAARRDGAR